MGRVEQGRTEPFLCRCTDGATYVVKGRSAGRRGLASEVICAGLAQILGLPVPEPVIVHVPAELLEASDAVGLPLTDLGTGPAFGSLHVKAVEFTMAHRDLVSEEQRQAVAVFDWWICNEDRTLTPLGGNVNLLWAVPPIEGLVVIDHNLALESLDRAAFLTTHVFASDFLAVAADFVLRDAWRQRLQAAADEWDHIVSEVPPEWDFIDFEQTVPSNVDFTAMKERLDRCRAATFWDQA
ncbi:MAG: hypothetical protein EOO30_01725 [Comamonadaceae bacterium]|nr:MAG: hypothetical protein EOO30_01725 [Comamonadaceae bacterium]